MIRVAGPGNNRKIGKGRADATGQASHQHGIVHREDKGGRVSQLKLVDEFASRDVAEKDGVACLTRSDDVVDVAVDRKVGLLVLA